MRDCLGTLGLGFLYNTGYDLQRSESLCEELLNPQHVEVCKELLPGSIMIERPSFLKGF